MESTVADGTRCRRDWLCPKERPASGCSGYFRGVRRENSFEIPDAVMSGRFAASNRRQSRKSRGRNSWGKRILEQKDCSKRDVVRAKGGREDTSQQLRKKRFEEYLMGSNQSGNTFANSRMTRKVG